MALADRLRTISKDIETKKEEVVKQTEEQKLAPIRSEISDLESKENRAKELLEKMDSSRKTRRSALTDLGAKRNVVHGAMEENQVALEAMGIKNKADLEAHEELGQEPEIQAMKESRSNAESAKQTEAEILNELGDLLGNRVKRVGEKPNRHELQATAQIYLGELAARLKELRMQTPEGIETVKEQLRKELAPVVQEGRRDSFRADKIKKLSEEYPANLVQEALKEEISAQVSGEFESKETKTELGMLTQDMHKLEGLEQSRAEVWQSLKALREKRDALEQHLIKLFANPEDYGRIADQNYYNNPPANSPERAAQLLIAQISGKGRDDRSRDSVDRYDTVRALAENLKTAYDATYSFSSGETVIDPDYVKRAMEYANKRLDILLEVPDAREMTYEIANYYTVHWRETQGLENLNSKSPAIVFSKPGLELIKKNRDWNRVQSEFEKVRKEADQKRDLEIERQQLGFEKAAILSKLKEKFDYRTFGQIERNVESLRRKKEQVKLAELDFTRFHTQAADLSGVKVRISSSEVEHLGETRAYVNVYELEKEAHDKGEEIEKLEKILAQKKIDLRNNQATKRGFLNKKKLEEEASSLQNEILGYQAQLDKAKAEQATALRKIQRLAPASRLLAAGEVVREVSGEMTVAEMFSRAQKAYAKVMEQQPDEEDQRLYDEHKALQTRLEAIERQMRASASNR